MIVITDRLMRALRRFLARRPEPEPLRSYLEATIVATGRKILLGPFSCELTLDVARKRIRHSIIHNSLNGVAVVLRPVSRSGEVTTCEEPELVALIEQMFREQEAQPAA